MAQRPQSAPGAPVADGAESAGQQSEAVRTALDLPIGPEIDLEAATATLLAAHDALHHRLSDLSG